MQTIAPSFVHGVHSPSTGEVLLGFLGCSGVTLGAGCAAGVVGFAAGGLGCAVGPDAGADDAPGAKTPPGFEGILEEVGALGEGADEATGFWLAWGEDGALLGVEGVPAAGLPI